jgi:hypothetical protein
LDDRKEEQCDGVAAEEAVDRATGLKKLLVRKRRSGDRVEEAVLRARWPILVAILFPITCLYSLLTLNATFIPI